MKNFLAGLVPHDRVKDCFISGFGFAALWYVVQLGIFNTIPTYTLIAAFLSPAAGYALNTLLQRIFKVSLGVVVFIVGVLSNQIFAICQVAKGIYGKETPKFILKLGKSSDKLGEYCQKVIDRR